MRDEVPYCGGSLSIGEATEKALYPYGRDDLCALEGELPLCEILIIDMRNVNSVDLGPIKSDIALQRKEQDELEEVWMN